MQELLSWLEHLQCPDCEIRSSFDQKKQERVRCSRCGREFICDQGIWNFLPSRIPHESRKDKERSGWTCKTKQAEESGWDYPAEHYLSLPDHPHPYYRAASRYMGIVLACGSPWKGQRALEIGAAECWGIRRLVEAGAEGVAFDYDPHRMVLGQILLDHLPIRFLRVQGDGERLPFADETFGRVFCCSVLHHFFDLPRAVNEIARVLRPGGIFFAIHEAYHPPYYRRERILQMSGDTVPNLSVGINEQSYTAAYYKKLFTDSGLEVQFLHPKWDVLEQNGRLRVEPGINVHTKGFVPLSLSARRNRNDLAGFLARFLLKSKLWRIGANRGLFPLLRFQVLNWTNKEKILLARKPD
jgi:SAM-dependent methyltransferase